MKTLIVKYVYDMKQSKNSLSEKQFDDLIKLLLGEIDFERVKTIFETVTNKNMQIIDACKEFRRLLNCNEISWEEYTFIIKWYDYLANYNSINEWCKSLLQEIK